MISYLDNGDMMLTESCEGLVGRCVGVGWLGLRGLGIEGCGGLVSRYSDVVF